MKNSKNYCEKNERVLSRRNPKSVQGIQNYRAEFLELNHVTKKFEDKLVWDGVRVFKLLDHPEAKKYYAWSSPVEVEGSDKRRSFAVLHIPPLTSVVEDVRASIVSD